MKKALLLTIVYMLMTTCFHTVSFAQKVVQIGSTEIVLQSPLKVNTAETEMKYRDGRSFNPFNVGLQCSLGFNGFSVYAKYRLTNCFNHYNIELEVPRLNIGIQFEI